MTPKEIANIRSNASEYAKRFLAYKYPSEYSELYEAYCQNRKLNTRSSHKPVVDERLLVGKP